MLFSSTLLTNSINRLQQSRNSRERYNGSNKQRHVSRQEDQSGFAYFVDYFFVVIAIIFFFLEFMTLFYCIMLAFRCTVNGPERIVHLVLATTFTLPYALVNAFWSPCGQEKLKGRSWILSSQREDSMM